MTASVDLHQASAAARQTFNDETTRLRWNKAKVTTTWWCSWDTTDSRAAINMARKEVAAAAKAAGVAFTAFYQAGVDDPAE